MREPAYRDAGAAVPDPGEPDGGLTSLYATNTGEERAMLASTTMIWIVIPLVVGLLSLRRSEVK